MPSELRLGEQAAPIPASGPMGVAAPVVCRRARSQRERADHWDIRRQIFVEEKAVFAGSDLDARDADDATIAVLGYSGGIPIGTVRLFLLDPDAERWQGDRLAVLSAYRAHGVGGPLVRYAVATAAVLGGRTMSAHIQPGNVTFFRRLGWTDEGEPEIYAGLPHQPMSIALPSYREGMATIRRLEGTLIGPGPSPG